MQSRLPSKAALGSTVFRTWTSRLTPAVLVLLGITLMAFHGLGSLPVEKLRVAVADVFTPIMSAASKPFAAFGESFEGVTSLRALKAENIGLKAENEKLHQWYESALKMQAENQSLRDLLNVHADPALSFVTARVVSDPGGAFVKSVLLPVGLKDNVRKGNAVMSGRGLVGRVVETGQRSSRVLLVSDLNSRIPVVIQNTRIKAILAGKNQDFMKLERLPVDGGISVGARVVTSGDGGQLPPDIPIGVIVEIGQDGVWVRPLSDIGRLGYVQVISADIDQSLVTGDLSPHAP